MPLVIICGYPSSGKSTLTDKLAVYLQGKGKEVKIVREGDKLGGNKNGILDDSIKEKELRAKIKSEAQRLLTKENVVIIDGLNYIKGYRYELFCMSKSLPTRQLTLHSDISAQQAWELNILRDEVEQYNRDVFDHLIQRFEQPDPQNRWDSPYVSVLFGEELDMEKVFQSLFFNKAPKQNQSTQSKPVSESNFLHSLEKVTSDIIQAILTEQKTLEDLENVSVPHAKATISLENPVTLAQLSKLKRQFMSLTKTSTVQGEPGELFVQYLNSQFGNTS